jgi:hypothetical protein
MRGGCCAEAVLEPQDMQETSHSARWTWARYGLSTGLCLIATWGIYLGGVALAIPIFVVSATGFVLDDLIGDEKPLNGRPPAWFCNANLYLAAPLLMTLSIVHMLLINRNSVWQNASAVEVLAATPLVGYLYALLGATVGHELVHRANKTAASMSARILLAFTFNTSFSVFHLSGHHRYVATLRDPASARRGETWLAFFMRTVWYQTAMAIDIEAARLRRQNKRWLSWTNRILRGQLYTAGLMLLAYCLAGFTGVLAFLAAAFIGRVAHELINYVQHYGLVRLEGTPIEDRHSWDCKRLISNSLQFNLPRHADHHVHADRHFWDLTSNRAAPELPYGYQTMAMIALVPAWWRRLMGPRLTKWDREQASAAERQIIAERGWEKLA